MPAGLSGSDFMVVLDRFARAAAEGDVAGALELRAVLVRAYGEVAVSEDGPPEPWDFAAGFEYPEEVRRVLAR